MQTLELLSGAASIDTAEAHPNKMKFKGVLVRLDEPSSKPPNGAEGHKIMVPADVAKKRLKTLIGMGLNYAEKMDGHAQRRKVGVIENAYIDGHDLWVEGIVWKHDFPEAQTDLKQRNLGMSMEIGQVEVEDADATVWKLNDFYFLGATILYRDAAAYHRTQAIAAQLEQRRKESMPQTKTATAKKPDHAAIAEAAAKAAVKSVSSYLQSALKENAQILAGISQRMEDMDTRLIGMEAAAKEADIEASEDEDEIEVDASEIDIESGEEAPPEQVPGRITTKKKVDAKEKNKDDDDKKKDEVDDDDDADDDDMETEAEQEACGEPGKLGDEAKNYGSETKLNDSVGKTVSSSALRTLRQQVNHLTASQARLERENKQLRQQLKTTQRQVQAASDETGRRSAVVHPEIQGLLEKAGVNSRSLNASGERMSVDEVDAVINSAVPGLGVVERMTLKNKFLEMGLMDDGRINRGLGVERR